MAHGLIVEVAPLGAFTWEQQEEIIFNKIKAVVRSAETESQLNAFLNAHLFYVRVRELHTIMDRWVLAAHTGERSYYPGGLIAIGDGFAKAPGVELNWEDGFSVDLVASHTYHKLGEEYIAGVVAAFRRGEQE